MSWKVVWIVVAALAIGALSWLVARSGQRSLAPGPTSSAVSVAEPLPPRAPVREGVPRPEAPASSVAVRDARAPSADERLTLFGVVLSPDGSALGGAQVLVAAPRHAAQQEWNIRPLEAPDASAESAADGSFRVRVERVVLHIVVRAAGCVERNLVRAPVRGVNELDLGVLALERAVTLPGRVVDGWGKPVADARVLRVGYTSLSDGENMDWNERELARSAADGTFVIAGLALGRTEVEVRAPGFVRLKKELFVEGYAAPEWRVELERALPITGRVLGAPTGCALEVYFWLKETDEQRYVPCAADGSFVIDELPREIEPLNLCALRRVTPERAESLSLSATALPGDRGVELRVPPAVTYRLRVTAAAGSALAGAHVELLGANASASAAETMPGEYALTVQVPWMDGAGLSVAHEGHATVVLGELPFVPGTTHELGDVALTPLGATHLRVLDDSSGAPVAGARVRAELAPVEEEWNDVFVPWPARSVLPATFAGTSAADGTATVWLSSSLRYRLWVEDADHAPLDVLLDVGAAPPPELELRLLRGGTVSLLCRDASTRAPLAGTKVRRELHDDANDWWRMEERETDAEGRVRFEHIVPGTHRFWPKELDADDSAQWVEVADGAEVELTYLRPADRLVKLHGVVSEHGRPLAGAVVDAWGSQDATDLEGRYEFDGLEPEEIELAVTHPRFGMVFERSVRLVAPETRVDVALQLAELAGVVRDVAANSVPGALVYVGVRARDGGADGELSVRDALHSGFSAPDGGFRFAAVQPCAYQYLVVERDGFLTQRIGPLAFPPDGSALMLLPVLERAESLAIVVPGWSMQKLGMVEVHAVWRGDEGLAPQDRRQSASPGDNRLDGDELRFHFERLHAGPWAIELRPWLSDDEDAPLARAEVTLPRNSSEPLVLRP